LMTAADFGDKQVVSNQLNSTMFGEDPGTAAYVLIPICAQFHYVYGESPYAIFLPSSPYAYGESPYAYGDQILTYEQSFLESRVEPEQGSRLLPVCILEIPIRIRRVTLIPVCIQGFPKKGSPYAYGDLRDSRMYTRIIQSLTVCIWEIFPYGKSSLVSPYVKISIWGSLYAYGDLSMHMVDPSMHTVGDR
jgi:hypothetical protein